MKLTRIFIGIFVFILALNPGLLVAANDDEIITEGAEHVHINYIDNAIIPPFFGTDTVNRALIYGDYLPLYMSKPTQFVPYPTSTPPYKNLWNSAQEVINAANNPNDPLHAQALNLRSFADAMIAMEQKENSVKYNLSQQDINFALNQQSIYFYEFNGIPPSSIWQYNPVESLQSPYHPNSLMQLDNTFIAPMNQWNSVTYNPSEDYIEELDELLHPVPDMSFLDEVFKQNGPLGDLGSALADVANPYTFLPALFMLGMDIYLQSQKQIGFLYPTITGYQISPCPESGMIMIKNNGQQMIYNISGGESGSITNIPSGDFGTFFVDAVNSFSGGIRPSVSLINDDMLNGGRVQYNNISSEYQSQDYSLNLESHVGVAQNNLELCDTVICKIQGSGPIAMIPFKIGSWFKCDQDQKGDIKSKTTIGVRFKDDDKYYTYNLADCALNNINNSASVNQNGILMWSGVISIYAEEYGKSEIEEIYLALNSSAKKTSGLNKVNCYTSLSFSPYFLKPIVSLPQDIETYPEEEVTFQTELLEELTNASVNVSWEIPSGTESLEGYEVMHTFTEPGIYDCKLMVDPEYQARPPAVEITDPQEKFWNTNAGKIVFPFQVKVLPPVDLEVSWSMPPCIPLNSKNYPGQIYYPGRTSFFSFYLTNKGNKGFIFDGNNPSSFPLTLSFFIDRDDNLTFSSQELVWSSQITGVAAQSSVFYNLEKIFSLDRLEGESVDSDFIYNPGFHLCKLQVNMLSQELNHENNSIIENKEFVESPEMLIPDFAVENDGFTVDQYRNIEVHFNLAEKSVDTNIVEKWNTYHENNPFIPQWGPIAYELWLRNGRDVNILLYSGEVNTLSYQETKSIQIDSINLNYVPSGDHSVYLGLNPDMLIAESKWDNNHGFMGWFTLTDDRMSPWFTKGGDRGHTGWKNIDLKPPLITDWVIETEGIPVDIVCNSDSFYALTSSGTIEKYNASGELQYSMNGFDGTPLQSSVMLLIHPDTENERLLAFSDDYRLVLIDTQSGNKIWTSNHIFTETTYGSRKSLKEYSRSLDYDGHYLLAGWPIALYHFESSMSQPELFWQSDKQRSGEVFLLGNYILAGQYLYSLDGEELEYCRWMHDHAIRYLQNIFTDRYKYNYLSGQLSQLEEMWNLGSLFSDKIIAGRQMQCFDYQGNQQWTLPRNIEQEYYAPYSPQGIPVYIEPESIIILGSDTEAYAYCINHGYQLLAIDLISGQPVWYREFVEPPESIKNLREDLPDYVSSQFDLNYAFHQTPLSMTEGFAVDITRLIPFQNSLLVVTVGQKIYHLSSSCLDHLEVQGYIPSVFYGPASLKIMVQAVNEQGMEIPLDDKITVTGDYINLNHPRYYRVQDEISLPVKLSDSDKISVDYPEAPFVESNSFCFVDVQALSPRYSVPLEINNIQSRPRISQRNVPLGEVSVLSMNEEAEVLSKTKHSKNSINLYYSGYGQENDISQVLYEHSYNLGVSIRDIRLLAEDYEFINLHIHIPEGMIDENFSVKINKETYNDWSLTDHTLIINCLNAFLEQNTNNLSIIILKSSE